MGRKKKDEIDPELEVIPAPPEIPYSRDDAITVEVGRDLFDTRCPKCHSHISVWSGGEYCPKCGQKLVIIL